MEENRKRKIIVLTKNYERYISGNYHMDLLRALEKKFEVYKYGEGYPNYDISDTINEVINKSGIAINDLYAVVVSTTWEDEREEVSSSDPHPNIDLNNLLCKKLFFLNKEYKKIDYKLDYIKKNRFDLVITVLPERTYKEWEVKTGIKFMQSHFGINSEEFKDMNIQRKYDFTFTGNLHVKYTDKRIKVKKELFDNKTIKSNIGRSRIINVVNPIKKEYRHLNIYWAEWGAKSVLGHSLLPTGKEYVKLMNESKVFLSTLSADGILGTRFFEIMATKAVLFCPEDDYYGVLQDGVNCIMYKQDMSDFKQKLFNILQDNNYREEIVNRAFLFAKKQTYEERIELIFSRLEENIL